MKRMKQCEKVKQKRVLKQKAKIYLYFLQTYKQLQMNSQPRTITNKQLMNSKSTQPLFIINQARIKIYSDCIVAERQQFQQIKTNDTAEYISITDENKLQDNSKNKHMQETVHKNKISKQEDLIIMFNNADFAFKIQENQKNIQIHDLIHKCVCLQFKVSGMQTLLTVQNLLRKKMCQLGFQTKYKIIKLLGKGASAQVHLVERLSDKKQFAAKIISMKNANDKSYQTFINESKLLRFLRHRNIIHLESLYIHKKQLIQVMEYLNGGTLLQLIRSDLVSEKKQKWKVLRDLMSALDYLRQRRIVHRDIKLQNILVRNVDGIRQYVLSDFGLACWTGEKHPIFQRCGTPGYIAPQVLNAPKGKPVLSHKADIFSIGVIAHILFLHQSLFPYSGNVKQLLKLNKKAQFSLQSSIYKDLSLSQITFLQMALAKEPQERSISSAIINQLKYHLGEINQITPRKSVNRSNSKQKVNINPKQFGVQVKVKRPTSLTKKKIDLSVGKIQSRAEVQNNKSQEKRPISSARKLFSDVWASLTGSTPKKQTLRIKQNSIQKHKRLSQFF